MKLTVDQKMKQADIAHNEGKIEEAERLYRTILEIQPKHPYANHNLGVLQYNLGRLEEAEASYKKAIDFKPAFVLAYDNLGNILKDLGRLEEAEESYKKSIKFKPNNVEAHCNLSAILINLGKFDEAEISCRKAIELKPDYEVAYSNLSSILFNLGKFKEAEISSKKAIELNPNCREAYNNLGVTLEELGRLEEAVTTLKKSIELNPNYAEAHYNLGNTLHKLNKFEEAESRYKKALRIKPDYAQAYNNLGTTLKELNKPENAEVNYRKAIEFKADYIEANQNLDMILREKALLIFLQKKKSDDKNKVSLIKKVSKKFFEPDLRLTSNPFISNREVESDLITNLYKISSRKLDKTKGPLFGNGTTSIDFQMFEKNNSIIKTVEEDLILIMKRAVNSDVYVMESFLNIFGAGGGSVPHTHLSSFDNFRGLDNQKYSLQYYLSIGDQNCSKPGVFKLNDPDEEILPSDGMVMIIPSSRRHSAIYNGKTDRVMIGVNFYSLI